MLLMNLIATDFDTQANMLRCVTTPYELTAKVSQSFRTKSMAALSVDPSEPEDEIVEPP
ncbi:hypothetical protein AB4P97_08200 [Pseudomonas sp. A1230]|uniref:hypothetical protein n=1 Tax=Pseudomonas sp. A1230 TaxID=3235106 RepID=UPI0037838C74